MGWEFEELFNEIYEDYSYYRSENASLFESLGRTWDMYENVIKMGEMERIVVYVALGELSLLQVKVFVNYRKLIFEALNTLNIPQLQQVLRPEQMTDLLARRNHVIQNIEYKPIDVYPIARWYYSEMREEVNKYLDTLIQEKDYDFDDIILSVQKRFREACKNTFGENMNVKTTLAEFLLSENITYSKSFESLKSEIQQFNPEELGEQLSLEEKEELSLRIHNCLSQF